RNIAPGGAHTEASRALFVRATRGRERFLHLHQVLAIDVRVVTRGLRAVRAILRAATGFDAEEHAALYLIRAVMGAMDLRRPEYQAGERRAIDGFDFGDGPVVPE